jgi:hypothetical protein
MELKDKQVERILTELKSLGLGLSQPLFLLLV